MHGNSKKIYILGASGFLGDYFSRYFRSKGFEVLTERVNVANQLSLKETFKNHKPDIVINCAGVRAYPNIDWCEDHKEETLSVNVCGAVNAMAAAIEVGAYPIQIMSGCIYSGGPEKQFTEENKPNFYGSFYSRMKIVLQDVLKELPVLQARVRMPICGYSHPRNLVNKIAAYKKVISVPNSVTLIEDLSPALGVLINDRVTGILNLTNEGYVEHKNILEAYRKFVDPNHSYELISLGELESTIIKAGRSNCVLSAAKAKSLGINMPALDDKRLKDLMTSYKKSLDVELG